MKYILILLCFLLLTGCATSAPVETPETTEPITQPTVPSETVAAPPTEPPDPIQALLEQMSLEERVGQLFLVRCVSNTALVDIDQYHLGGLVLYGQDFEGQTPNTLRKTLGSYQAAAKIPLLIAVDEEGGTVARISRYSSFRGVPFPAPREAYDQSGLEGCLDLEEEKCQLLSSLDISVNLGPVCDISTDPQAFIYKRSLGQDAETTAQYVSQTVELMNSYYIGSVLKHFPGYGNNTDTHTGIATDSRSLAALEGTDLIPFAAGIEAGCGAVMVSHTIVEALDDTMPASLSPAVHTYLRDTMGFDGVILTDDLAMEAITDQYGAGEAAVLAVLAGNDLLCSTDYALQYDAVLEAVMDARIDIPTLNSAVKHVLRWKMELGLIDE